MLRLCFFEESRTVERYLDFLSLVLVSAVTAVFPDIHTETLCFQQDTAPPHFGIKIEWPPRSLESTPLDCFLWNI